MPTRLTSVWAAINTVGRASIAVPMSLTVDIICLPSNSTPCILQQELSVGVLLQNNNSINKPLKCCDRVYDLLRTSSNLRNREELEIRNKSHNSVMPVHDWIDMMQKLL